MARSAAVTSRTVIHGDGLAWLEAAALGPEHAIVTSLPDVSEMPEHDLGSWSTWFTETARLCCERAHPQGVVIFYQTDIKHSGRWIDKAHLVHRGADAANSGCLWHKVVCRVAPGNTTFGRPAFGHMLCFSRARLLPPAESSPDVIPDLGVMTWSRAMPSSAAEAVCRFLGKLQTPRTVVDPFCGRGTILALANHHGFDALGVEISRKRAKKARNLSVDSLFAAQGEGSVNSTSTP